jgi:hypothetical protein
MVRPSGQQIDAGNEPIEGMLATAHPCLDAELLDDVSKFNDVKPDMSDK